EITPKTCHSILDLYCGVGVTSLLFAREGKKVIGIESHEESIRFAQKNAQTNNLSSAEFFVGKAEELSDQFLPSVDLVLCNPPREGLDAKLLHALIQHKPLHIFYVPCMPSTLASYLQQLAESGYEIESLVAFVLFPQTTHVETIV